MITKRRDWLIEALDSSGARTMARGAVSRLELVDEARRDAGRRFLLDCVVELQAMLYVEPDFEVLALKRLDHVLAIGDLGRRNSWRLEIDGARKEELRKVVESTTTRRYELGSFTQVQPTRRSIGSIRGCTMFELDPNRMTVRFDDNQTKDWSRHSERFRALQILVYTGCSKSSSTTYGDLAVAWNRPVTEEAIQKQVSLLRADLAAYGFGISEYGKQSDGFTLGRLNQSDATHDQTSPVAL